MPTKHTSYDDIVRRTVPEPDSGFRPTREQVKQAYEGFRALDVDEQALHDRVREALGDSGLDIEKVSIEIEGDRVFLRGHVEDERAMARVAEIVRDVEGVGVVVDQLVVLPPGAAD